VQSGAALNVERLIKDDGGFTGIETFDDKGDDAAELFGGCVWGEQFDAGDGSKPGGELAGMLEGGCVAFFEAFHCEASSGAEPGDCGGVGSSAFEARRGIERLFERSAVSSRTAEDERLQELLSMGGTGEKPNAGRPGESLVGGGGEVIDFEGCERAGPVADSLSGIEQNEGTVSVGDLGERFDVLNASGDIGCVTEHHKASGGLLQAFEELVGIQQSGFGAEWEVGDGDAAGLLEVIQWAEDRVVFEFGSDDVVTGLQESEDDGVETGRAAGGEEDGFGAVCMEQIGDSGAGLEEQSGGVECG